MKGKHLVSNQSFVDKEGGDAAAATQLNGEVILGDLIWIRLFGTSWWPAQVVDDNTVRGSNKPSNRSASEVLVRLYGSYKYVYVDPMKYRSEFENILKQHGGSHSEIFKKSLEQDLPDFKSVRSKGKGSKSEEKVRVVASQDKRSKRNLLKECQELESPTSTSGALGKHSAARVQGTRMLKTDLDAKASTDNASENERTQQHNVKKNLVDNGTNAKVSQMILAANTPQAKVRNDNSFSVKTEEARSKKRKQDEVQRKLDPNSPKSARLSSRKKPAASALQTIVKNGNLLPGKATEAKSKKRKQDKVNKNLEPNIPISLSLSPKTLQTTVKNGDLLSKKTVAEAKSRPKQGGMQEILRSNGPESAIPLLGKSPELSARRMKVMQSLGLIAPSGSPFHRNGHIYPKSVHRD
ncbi:hypothetical protein F0562_027783 [Nyssa sinensis]|uniref:PWWP domain-containing protein n=1 Tax=Nyssa sinensis TaxID=561372 RepID=A0A5J5B4J8_9ASTE|nr:hypothetical protein F0562_027783 [Nyssa sinensis]